MPRTVPIRPTALTIVAVVVVALAAFLIASAARTGGTSPARAATTFLVAELVVLAVAVPLFHSMLRGEGSRLAAFPVAAAGFFFVACLVLSRSCAGLAWGKLAATQLPAAGFAALVWAIATATRRCGARAPLPQVVASFVAIAMVGNVFFANPLVEAFGPGEAKLVAVALVLWTNPWLAAAGSVLEADPLRSAALYRFSVIPEYGFRYPASTLSSAGVRALVVAAAYLACACLVWLIASGLGRRRPAAGD